MAHVFGDTEFHADAPAPRAAPAAPSVPGYELLRELGRGGMGVVYLARQLRPERAVALKVVLHGGHAAPGDLARFRAEGEIIAGLRHANVVPVYEVGTHAGLPFFSLEYCPGGSLDRKLAGRPLAPADSAGLVRAVARGAEAAHRAGVVHRDLKPANVLLAEDGTPKLADFGLARRVEDSGFTRTGVLLGTPSYMAPEQAAGGAKSAGPAVDVYALGAILYECLTGRPPFLAATPMDTVAQVLEADPAPPRLLNPAVPRSLEAVCLKCLQKSPESRYPTAEELALDLGRFLDGEPVLARSDLSSRVLGAWGAESRHTQTLALFGRVWVWQAAVAFLLGVAFNALSWAGHDGPAEVGAVLAVGLAGFVTPGFYYLMRKGRVRTPVERQMDQIFVMFLVAVAVTTVASWGAGAGARGLLPALAAEGALAVGCTAVVLRGSLYPLAGLCALTAPVLAWAPSVGPLAFGAAFAAGLLIPARRYCRLAVGEPPGG